MGKPKIIVLAVVMLAQPAIAAAAGSFSLPSVNVSTCAPFNVALSTSDAAGGVAFDFDIEVQAGIAVPTSASLTSLSQGCSYEVNFIAGNPGVYKIAMACLSGLSANSGDVITIQFSPVANGTTALGFAQCLVDEQTCASTQAGQINVSCFPDPTPTPSGPPCTCIGDADKNGFVNFSDYTAVQANFGTSGQPGTGVGDANCDGFVNFSDYTAIQANFGQPCPP